MSEEKLMELIKEDKLYDQPMKELIAQAEDRERTP